MHAGFGKRPEETGRPVGRYRASGRLYRPPTTLIVEFIDRYKEAYGVEPICAQLKELGCGFAPSSYYEARSRPESRRALRDKELKAAILKEYDENYRCYGARKMWLELRGRHLTDTPPRGSGPEPYQVRRAGMRLCCRLQLLPACHTTSKTWR